MIRKPETRVIFQTDDTSLQHLMREAEQRAKQNIRLFGGRRVLVEGGGYDKIWLETQPMGGAMYAKRDLDCALNNQLLFMDSQREDGRLPGSIAVIDGKVTPQFNKFQGFCFPDPALDVWYLTGKDPEYLSYLYEVLQKFDDYLWRTRDSDGDGCLESWCQYDTGEDNALRYGDAEGSWSSEKVPEGYNTVPIESMDVMSYSSNARDVMAEIDRIQGREEKAGKDQQKADAVKSRIRDYLWDDSRGSLFDRDKDNRIMPFLIHNPLRCMYWKSISQEMADRFVREHLLNPEEFWTPMPLPSVSVSDPLFRNAKENNWSGQSEALTWQRAIRALENYEWYSLIPILGRKLFAAVGYGSTDTFCANPHFVQQFDPFTGIPSGIGPDGNGGQNAYGPAILSVMEYCSRMYGVHLERDKIIWGTVSGPDSTYEQIWGNHCFRIILDKDRAIGFIDGRIIFRGKRDLRIVTDRHGNILQRDSYLPEKKTVS